MVLSAICSDIGGRLPDSGKVRWVAAAGPAEVQRVGETSSVTSGSLSPCLLSYYEWVMCALLGRVLICKSYGDECYDKQDIYGSRCHRAQKSICYMLI